ncbi:MAG: hypothetical protein DRJ67_05965, partial [Thermoprotei archaeon]
MALKWRALAERLAALAATLALARLFSLTGSPALDLDYALAVACLSLALPGLGPAALLATHSYALALSGGLHVLESLLMLLAAALALRYWLQASLWALALLTVDSQLLNTALLGSLIASLQAATPTSASALMVAYALMVSLRLYSQLPSGAVGAAGMVVAMGGHPDITGIPLLDAARLAGSWLSTNVLGPPNLLVQVLAYAAAGAAAPKIREVVGRGWLAPLPSAALVLASAYVTMHSLGLATPRALLLLPLASAAAGLARGRRSRARG